MMQIYYMIHGLLQWLLVLSALVFCRCFQAQLQRCEFCTAKFLFSLFFHLYRILIFLVQINSLTGQVGHICAWTLTNLIEECKHYWSLFKILPVTLGGSVIHCQIGYRYDLTMLTWFLLQQRPEDNDRYVKNCRNGRSPKETRWWFHDDKVW